MSGVEDMLGFCPAFLKSLTFVKEQIDEQKDIPSCVINFPDLHDDLQRDPHPNDFANCLCLGLGGRDPFSCVTHGIAGSTRFSNFFLAF